MNSRHRDNNNITHIITFKGRWKMDQPGGHTLIFTILIYLHILHKTLTDFEFIRKKYFEPHFINRPNILKFCNLMNSKSVSVLCNMCKYIRIVERHFNTIKRFLYFN
jgi:hypothetical protein